jgi:predicted permease
MINLYNDIKFGLRLLAKSPAFAATVILILALGIGSTTALFSVINAVLLRALPYEQPEQLVQLWGDPSADGRGRNSVAAAEFMDWKEHSEVMQDMSVIRRVHRNLTGQGQPERLDVLQVSASYLDIFRVRPLLGRAFLPDEDQPGRDNVVLLTHRFWQRYFGGHTDIVGRSIQLGDDSCMVIGVLPPKPRLPYKCDVLVPFVYGSEAWHQSRRDNRLRVIARLKPGVTVEQARAHMHTIKQRIKPLYPEYKQAWGISVVPLHEQITGQVRPQLWILFSAVGFVLLIVCANIANLLLAKTATRRKEIAMRVALGARRLRIFRQLLTESTILSLLGGAFGFLLAYWGVSLFKHAYGASLPWMLDIGLDGRVLGFSLLVSLVTGMLFGIVPTWQMVRLNLNEVFKGGTRSSQAQSNTIRGGLIAAEISLALILLIGTGLLLKSLLQLQSVPVGFNPEGVLAIDISLNDQTYPKGGQRMAFLKQIVQRIESLPGVETAGTATTLPMSGATDNSVRAENKPDQDEFYINTDYDFISGHYYRAMGIQLLKGRVFTENDNVTRAPRVTIINKALAHKVFPHVEPLGQRVRFLGQSWEIVGVVADVHHRGLDSSRMERIYLPQVFSFLQCSLVIRTNVPPLSLVEGVRSEIFTLDPQQPISNIRTLERVVANSISDRHLMFLLLSLFAGAALLLAAIGLYGVMAYSVTRRTQEIGIRMALGAPQGRVLTMVVRQGMKLIMIGVAIGLLGAVALTRVLSHLLFEITPTDPVTFVGVTLLLGTVGLLACWLPARRAARIDPMKALRYE